MGESDWNAEAEAMARSVAEQFPDVPLGVIEGRQARVSIVFGNPRAQEPAAVQAEVSRVREVLDQAGIRILGFGTDLENQSTWAMVVESEDVAMLSGLVSPS